MLSMSKGQKHKSEVKRESISPAPVQPDQGADATGSEHDNGNDSDTEHTPKRQVTIQTQDNNTSMHDVQPDHPSDQIIVKPPKGNLPNKTSWEATRLELVN